MAAKIEDLKSQLSQMESERYGFANHWQEIVDYIMWFRQNITTTGPAGAKKMSKINDGTPTYYAMLFGAGFSAKNRFAYMADSATRAAGGGERGAAGVCGGPGRPGAVHWPG
jgi:hypothetical protein